MRKIFLSDSPESTQEIGEKISKKLKKGDIVFLKGNLGAGKTTFVQGIFHGLGIKSFAKSSSFILVNEYQSEKIKLYHIDLYRLENVALEDIGLEEYFYGSGICIIEWAEKITQNTVTPSWEISLTWQDANKRKIEVIGNKA